MGNCLQYCGSGKFMAEEMQMQMIKITGINDGKLFQFVAPLAVRDLTEVSQGPAILYNPPVSKNLRFSPNFSAKNHLSSRSSAKNSGGPPLLPSELRSRRRIRKTEKAAVAVSGAPSGGFRCKLVISRRQLEELIAMAGSSAEELTADFSAAKPRSGGGWKPALESIPEVI